MPTTTIKAPKISLGIRRPADAVAKVQYGGLDLSHLYVTDKPLGLLRTCGRLLKSKRGLRTSVLVDKPALRSGNYPFNGNCPSVFLIAPERGQIVI